MVPLISYKQVATIWREDESAGVSKSTVSRNKCCCLLKRPISSSTFEMSSYEHGQLTINEIDYFDIEEPRVA